MNYIERFDQELEAHVKVFIQAFLEEEGGLGQFARAMGGLSEKEMALVTERMRSSPSKQQEAYDKVIKWEKAAIGYNKDFAFRAGVVRSPFDSRPIIIWLEEDLFMYDKSALDDDEKKRFVDLLWEVFRGGATAATSPNQPVLYPSRALMDFVADSFKKYGMDKLRAPEK